MMKHDFFKQAFLSFQKHWKLASLVIAGVGLTSIGTFGVIVSNQNSQNRTSFSEGTAAYDAANCGEAVRYLREISYRDILFHNNQYFEWAQPKIQECKDFQNLAVHKNDGRHVVALEAASKFLENYKDSHLTKLVYERTEEIFQENPHEEIVNADFCSQVGHFTKLKLIPQPDNNLPLFYFACGNYYKNEKVHYLATIEYKKLINSYSKHELVSEAQVALADIDIETAKSGDVDMIDLPYKIGSTNPGMVKVIIQNDAPEILEITFSGPEALQKEITKCENCQTFVSPPEYCPEKGPVQEYTLAPGEYEVLFKSPKPSTTKPMVGDWNLEDGAKYYMCSYIVKQNVNDSPLPSADTFKVPHSFTVPPDLLKSIEVE